VLVRNAGHMLLGPGEAFSHGELAGQYDVNVLETQRINRTVLPHLRAQGSGRLVWISSTSARGGGAPFAGPYFAAKAAMDSLAVSYAGELVRFGFDTIIVVPGAYTSGTNHFANAGGPADAARATEFDNHYGDYLKVMPERLAALIPGDARPGAVADVVVAAVSAPAGPRPYRVHIDPAKTAARSSRPSATGSGPRS